MWKDEVLKQIDEWIAEGEYRYTNATDYLKKRVMQMSEWISVDDRLPERFERVLSCDLDGEVFIDCLEEVTETKGYFAYGGDTVTYWMPLPNLPDER